MVRDQPLGPLPVTVIVNGNANISPMPCPTAVSFHVVPAVGGYRGISR
jgi:hypothetical protein